MSKQISSAGVNDRAEGSPKSSRNREPLTSVQTASMPAIHLTEKRHGPAAETGMIEMVVASAEAKENSDAQDASRIPAEISAAAFRKDTVKPHPTILIIEDSTELAEIIEATLQRLDMITAHETHGNKALNRFNHMEPDVILLDIGLPDMTGWKLLEDLRDHKTGANMPAVIVITAYGDPANRLIGKLQNVYDYLIKPFTADEVERVVIGALSSTRK